MIAHPRIRGDTCRGIRPAGQRMWRRSDMACWRSRQARAGTVRQWSLPRTSMWSRQPAGHAQAAVRSTFLPRGYQGPAFSIRSMSGHFQGTARFYIFIFKECTQPWSSWSSFSTSRYEIKQFNWEWKWIAKRWCYLVKTGGSIWARSTGTFIDVDRARRSCGKEDGSQSIAQDGRRRNIMVWHTRSKW